MHDESILASRDATYEAGARAAEAAADRAGTHRLLGLREGATWACLIFVLCVMDAVCTVIHVRGGASELNPMMECLLAVGPVFFVATKLLLSAVTLGALAVLLPRVRKGRLCFLLIWLPYFGVCCYHVSGFVR